MKASKIILVAFALASCSPKIYPSVNTESKDSVRIEVHERIVHDTARVEIVREVERIVTRDTVSHLANTYAESVAEVSGGYLHHSLSSKPQVIKVPVTVEVHDTLTIEVHKEASTEVQVVQVEKELTGVQRFSIWGFWFIALGMLLYIGMKIWLRFRR